MKKINIQKKNFTKYISLTLMLSGVNVFGMNNLSNLEKEEKAYQEFLSKFTKNLKENPYQKLLRTDIYCSLSKIKNSLNDTLYKTYKEMIKNKKIYDSFDLYTYKMNIMSNIIYVLGEISNTIEKFYDSENLKAFGYQELLGNKIIVKINKKIAGVENAEEKEYNTIFDKDLFTKTLLEETLYHICYYIGSQAERASIVERYELINKLKKEGLQVYENILEYLQCLSLYIDIKDDSLNFPNFRNVPDSKISAELQILKLVETIRNFQKEIEDFKEEVIKDKKKLEEKIQDLEEEINDFRNYIQYLEKLNLTEFFKEIKEEEIKEEEYFKKDIQNFEKEIRFFKIAETEREKYIKDCEELINKQQDCKKDKKDFEEKIETQKRRKNKELFRNILFSNIR